MVPTLRGLDFAARHADVSILLSVDLLRKKCLSSHFLSIPDGLIFVLPPLLREISRQGATYSAIRSGANR